MFHQQLVILIIGLSLWSIQCFLLDPLKCSTNEEFKYCVRENVATCANKQASGPAKCSLGGQCVCAHAWLVRNEEGVCVPVWRCPGICPENAEFKGCNFSAQPSDTSRKITVEEHLQLCQPICFCRNHYSWSSKKIECIHDIPHGFVSMKG